MKQILAKLLQIRGIDSLDKLDKDEKETFEKWDMILSKEFLNVEDIKLFCQSQVGVIENKWKNLDLELSKKAELIPYHTVYKTLLTIISAPQLEREALENQLNNLIK